MAFGIDDALSTAVASVSNAFSTALDKIWPDANVEEQAKVDQVKMAFDSALAVFQGQVSSVLAEAQGESWLQKSWRPITMLTFLVLVVGHFFGIEGPNFTPDDSANLFLLIQIGLGGYVVGRSAEKIAQAIVQALSKK